MARSQARTRPVVEEKGTTAMNLAEEVRSVLRGMDPAELRSLVRAASVEQRDERNRREEEARLKKLSVVKFLQPYRMFNSGEIAGLPREEAHLVIKDGIALRVAGATPIPVETRLSEQTRDIERAQVEHIIRFMATLDQDAEGDFDESGLPNCDVLTRRTGFDVTPELRDAAWLRFRGAQVGRGE